MLAGGMRRLRAGLVTPPPGGPGPPSAPTTRGRLHWLDAARTKAGESLPDRGPGSGSVRARKLRPRGQKSRCGAPRGARVLERGRGKTEDWCAAWRSTPLAFRGEQERPRSAGMELRRTRRRKEYGRWRTRFLIPPLQGERERKSAKHDRREARASGDDAGARRIRRR